MPQAERAEIIKEFLKWLEAKSKKGGATRGECIRHIQTELTDMGAEPQRCMKYILACCQVNFIQIDGLKYRLTEDGKNWLQRKI